jgi:hypothetical protein
MDKADLYSPPATQAGLPSRDAGKITADAKYNVKYLWLTDIPAPKLILPTLVHRFTAFSYGCRRTCAPRRHFH